MRNVQYTITIAHRQFSSRTWLCVYVCVYVILLTHWLDWLPSLVTFLKLTDSSATAQVSYTSQYLQQIVHFYNDIRVCCDSCYVALVLFIYCYCYWENSIRCSTVSPDILLLFIVVCFQVKFSKNIYKYISITHTHTQVYHVLISLQCVHYQLW